MPRRMNVIVSLAIVVTVAAFLIVAILRLQHEQHRLQCANRLRQLPIGLAMYENDYGKLPSGTIPNPQLPPERRLSWLCQLHNYLVGGITPIIDKAQAWDAPGNVSVKVRLKFEAGVHDDDFRIFRCPYVAEPSLQERPTPTHYVGIAGRDPDAATLPLEDPRAGIFGYDRQCTLQKVSAADGTSNTMMIAETLTKPGPWTAGGSSTVRGLIPDGEPYLGPGGQFTSPHLLQSGWLSVRPRYGINVAFADGSIRFITASIDPRIVEAIATYCGREPVVGLDE